VSADFWRSSSAKENGIDPVEFEIAEDEDASRQVGHPGGS
jgi:hypothetical protein